MGAGVLSAITGLIGTIGGLPAGYKTASASTLDPAQNYHLWQMINALGPRLQGHFAKLAELGKNAPNAYEQLPNNFTTDFYGKVQLPSMQRQQEQLRQIGDQAHGRATNYARQQFQTQNILGANELKNSLMLRDLGLQTQAGESQLNRRLDALGMMGQTWMMPLGKSIENYGKSGLDTGTAVIGGLRGLSNLFQSIQNYQDQQRHPGPPPGNAPPMQSYMEGGSE